MADTNDTDSRSAFAQIFGSGTAAETTLSSSDPSNIANNESTKASPKNGTPEPPQVQKPADQKKVTPAASPATPSSGHEVGRIDAVRDLLFGDQVAELKGNLEAIERRLAARLDQLEADARSQIDNSERRLAEQIEGLTQDLRKESEARIDLSSEVVQKLDASTLDLTLKTDNLGEELRKRIQRETDNIRDNFSERAALSAMFADLSKSLGEPAENGI